MAWLLVLLAVAACVQSCPTECFCFGSTRVVVHCEFQNLSAVPMYIPVNTTHLFLHGNHFTAVTTDMFQGYVKNSLGVWVDTPLPLFQLQEIKLDLNPLPIVNEFAFLPAPTLQLIYLPFFAQIQYQALSEMRLDKSSFRGFKRVPIHVLEDPTFIAFSKY
ncbi:hypothetical protein SPRG_10215 [Saprolegnia parasitica CBS 223.65]|uniref:LRRNT domain-containing protein n=1 Tax=Saprolegnia parasitica (strain CBS 223.65) TaxID=695850 RepID=A0A067CD32_SAPPC|nr:hypothetical protein SPRG_10215 [Saprolegnia parasitica CBS 223.65]KDO24682.1 hypothetical protein SPRG_10215 [Saprolegnia parasitica CBS 223.65]|eukprot:XP_012204563.1 hypothetical protein SPRG_10215 [Saprolegnia parasitica CBS 223.65]